MDVATKPNHLITSLHSIEKSRKLPQTNKRLVSSPSKQKGELTLLTWASLGDFVLVIHTREKVSLSLSLPTFISLHCIFSLVVYFFVFPIWVVTLSPFIVLIPFFLFFLLSFFGFWFLSRMMKKARDEAKAVVLKHQILFQDYKQLLKEAEAKKRRLQKTIEKKLTLAAEVKYLWRKYKSFSSNPPLSPSQATPYIPKQLHHKMASPFVRFAKLQNSIKRPKMISPAARFAEPQNFMNNNELPLHDVNPRAKKSESPSTSTLFDLNKNAEEMEGIQAQWEPLKVANELNQPIFKGVGNGHSHIGNGTFSRQDQVALWV